MKIKKILLSIISMFGIFMLSSSFLANASSWHNSVPKKLIGTWTNKGKYKNHGLLVKDYIFISNKSIYTFGKDYTLKGKYITYLPPENGFNNRLRYKYLGNNTYKVKSYLEQKNEGSISPYTFKFHKNYMTMDNSSLKYYKIHHSKNNKNKKHKVSIKAPNFVGYWRSKMYSNGIRNNPGKYKFYYHMNNNHMTDIYVGYLYKEKQKDFYIEN